MFWATAATESPSIKSVAVFFMVCFVFENRI
jgi:hypothetical protein